MKRSLLYIVLLFSILVTAQEESSRGSKSKNTSEVKKGVKRALIVGISDYKEESLKLDFSDDDALIFKQYLEEVEKIPQERLVALVTNDSTQETSFSEPSSSNILRELRKLMDDTQEGDTVYFYFAGHGDVVDDQGFEEGFLLASDSNDNQEYYGTPGVVSLKHLNSVITAVTEKGAKFVLVLDACRSGFLYKEGTQKNLETFNNNFQHSTKFFSCGPNQLSYESKELGHGYFTYYLVLGLLGAADNLVQDNSLQYFEIATFLDGKVKSETNQKQAPIVWHQNTVGVFKAVESKDKELALKNLQGVSNIKNIWNSRSLHNFASESITENPIVKRFNKALKSENFYGSHDSAYELYKMANSQKMLETLVLNRMRHGLINALSTNAQILINTYIGNAEVLPSSEVFETKAFYLELCLELLEKDDFIYDRIYMSKLFLEAYAVIRARHYSKYSDAKNKLKEALKIEDRAAYIHNALGLVLNHENNFKEAEFHYEKAKKLIPSWSFPVNNIGANYYEQYQYDSASTVLFEALELKGSYGSVYNNLGAIAQDQGNYTKAEEYYHKVKEAEGSYSTITLKNLANLYRNKGNIRKAVDYFELALKSNPNYVYNYYSYSDLLNDESLDVKRAEELLKQAIELEPYFSQGHAEYADLLRRYPRDENSLKIADSLYNFAIENDPFYEWAYAGKGWLKHKQNLKLEALEAFTLAIQVNPKKPKPYYNLASYYKSGLSDVVKAEEFYLKAIERDSFYLPAYESLIGMYNKNNQEDKSIKLLNTLVVWHKDAPDVWNLLGNTYFDKRNFSEAIKGYQKAIEVDSTYAKGFTNLAYSLMRTGNYKDASYTYKKAVEYNPFKNKPENFSTLLLGESRKVKRNGNLNQAQLILNEAYSISADFNTSFALAELYYLNSKSNQARSIINNFMVSGISKTRKIKFLELACKVAIDLGLKEEALVKVEQLKEINPRPNYTLEALVQFMNGRVKESQETFLKTNTLLLREGFLKKSYSKKAINLIKQLKNDE
ncbi:tetratricopeptide repeat protein [Seonamhaeicola sp. MEBiC1930]|uniref:tetratricopeptide repeat protein n=1 Tax=Seonamhaeicola sp. MEBiC01930 TaxID=2976768 RepID=UPI00325192D0